MKTADDFKKALGCADPAFVAGIHRTLANFKEQEEEQPVRKKLSLSLALVIIACMLLATVAFAAAKQWGVLDFFVEKYGMTDAVLPETSAKVETDIVQTGGHTEYADFGVREAVFDGKYAYVVAAIKPANDRILLMGPGTSPDSPMSDLGPRFEGETTTIREYAKENGKETMVNVQMYSGIGFTDIDFDRSDYIMEEDGTLAYIATGPCVGDAALSTIEMTCLANPYTLQPDGEYMEKFETIRKEPLFFEVKAVEPVGRVESVEPIDFADCGVRVDQVTLTGTPMAVYTELRFTVIDEEKFAATENNLWFDYLNAEGEPILEGATMIGNLIPLGGSDTRFIQTASLGAMEAMPNEIMLRGSAQDSHCETHAVALKESK